MISVISESTMKRLLGKIRKLGSVYNETYDRWENESFYCRITWRNPPLPTWNIYPTRKKYRVEFAYREGFDLRDEFYQWLNPLSLSGRVHTIAAERLPIVLEWLGNKGFVLDQDGNYRFGSVVFDAEKEGDSSYDLSMYLEDQNHKISDEVWNELGLKDVKHTSIFGD